MSEYYFVRGHEPTEGQPWIIPEPFVEKVFGHYERRGSPFLQNQRKVNHRIYLDRSGILHLGRPWSQFPEVPTWRQFLIKYEGYSRGDVKYRLDKIGCVQKNELNDRVSEEYFYDQLAHNYMPAARFAHLVDSLKVGTSDEKAGEILGHLHRYEGSFTGSDILYMQLTEPTTLSWLQWAFNKAGEPANFYQL
jgi:hypothetical protein